MTDDFRDAFGIKAKIIRLPVLARYHSATLRAWWNAGAVCFRFAAFGFALET